MVGTGHGRRHATDHHDPTLLSLADETVPQGQCEFTSPEWQMTLAVVHGPDAFLESQETLVDLRPLYSPLPVVTLGVLCPFTACQIHQQQLAHDLA